MAYITLHVVHVHQPPDGMGMRFGVAVPTRCRYLYWYGVGYAAVPVQEGIGTGTRDLSIGLIQHIWYCTVIGMRFGHTGRWDMDKA